MGRGLGCGMAACQPPATSVSTAGPAAPADLLDMMGTVIADVGLTGTLAGWTAEIEWDEYVAIDRT